MPLWCACTWSYACTIPVTAKSVLDKTGPRTKNTRAKLVTLTIFFGNNGPTMTIFFLTKMVLPGPFLMDKSGPTKTVLVG